MKLPLYIAAAQPSSIERMNAASRDSSARETVSGRRWSISVHTSWPK